MVPSLSRPAGAIELPVARHHNADEFLKFMFCLQRTLLVCCLRIAGRFLSSWDMALEAEQFYIYPVLQQFIGSSHVSRLFVVRVYSEVQRTQQLSRMKLN